MKKLNKIIVILLSVLVVGIALIFTVKTISANVKKKLPEVQLINECCQYVNEFSYNIPKDEDVIERVLTVTDKVLKSEDDFYKYFEYSDYQKRMKADTDIFTYLLEKYIYNSEVYKSDYYAEVAVLRLKFAAFTGNREMFCDELIQYYNQINSFSAINVTVKGFILNDKNIKVKFEDEPYQICIEGYKNAFEKCNEASGKYWILQMIDALYADFPEASQERSDNKKKMNELINSAGSEKVLFYSSEEFTFKK